MKNYLGLHRYCNMLLLAVIMLICPFHTYAGGVFLYEIATPEVGLASAGWSSRANDPSTAFTNPAGMTRLCGEQFLLGAQPIYGHVHFDPNEETTVSGQTGYATQWLPSGGFYYVKPLSNCLSVGFSSLGYFGSSLAFNREWVGRYYVRKTLMQGFSAVPAVAYRLNDYFSIGAGVNIMYGIFRQKNAVNNFNDSLPDGVLRLGDQNLSAGGLFGILFEPSACMRFGVQYLTSVYLKFVSKPHFHNLGPLLKAALVRSGVFNSKVNIIARVPQSVIASAYYEIGKIAFMLDGGWQQWSKFQAASIALANADDTTLTFTPKYDDTWHIAFGIQYQLCNTIKCNTGFAYDSSAIKANNRPLNFPVGSQRRYGVGIDWQYSEKLSFDCCYEYQWQGNLAVDVSRGTLASRVAGEFSASNIQFINLDMKYRF